MSRSIKSEVASDEPSYWALKHGYVHNVECGRNKVTFWYERDRYHVLHRRNGCLPQWKDFNFLADAREAFRAAKAKP